MASGLHPTPSLVLRLTFLCVHLPQYNEVVVGTEHWAARLPYSVEAMFYSGDNQGDVRRIYSAFMDQYPNAHTILVRLDLWDPNEPFKAAWFAG